MSVIVKGIRKPKTCSECLFCKDNLRHLSDEYIVKPQVWCGALKNFHELDLKKIKKDVAEFCPLVEIPKSHGDLIDKDKLINSFIPDPILECGCPEPENLSEFIDWLDTAEKILEKE